MSNAFFVDAAQLVGTIRESGDVDIALTGGYRVATMVLAAIGFAGGNGCAL